ncbi:MAG: ROK family protein [Candidatus Obscuribacterales bacterium]|nr:ROK family protein [Candidatus Obscuribacterales bacterium]
MPGKYAVGIDFGGTKVLAGVVEMSSGRLIATSKKKTRNPNDHEDVSRRLTSVVDEALAEAGLTAKALAGIGVGAAGMVNREKGVLLNAVNLGLSEVPLTEPLSQYYGVPAKLGNDVEVATLGEMRFGAGKGCDHFVCIFVGTGIGGGIVVDGKLLRGASGTAGEIGHTVLYPNGRLCGCGAYGCLEAYASRTAIARQVSSEINRGHVSTVQDKIDPSKGILRSKAISQALDMGDPLVTRAVEDAARYMGLGLVSVINFLNPKRIILGGGLVEASQTYLDLASLEASKHCLVIARKKLDIVKAGLGDYAGIVGAAMLLANK